MGFGSPPIIGEKLTGSNYPISKAQISPYLQAANLLPILDGTEPAPSKFLTQTTNGETPVLNPNYSSWLIRDSIAMGWILNSSTSLIMAQLTRHTTAAAIWKYLAESYAAQSQARASALRLQFQSITKGNRSITEYLQEATSISDQLSTIGEPISSNEYHTHLFRGLGAKFAALDTAISVLSQTGALTRDALHGLVLQHEGRLELGNLSTRQPPPAAFAA